MKRGFLLAKIIQAEQSGEKGKLEIFQLLLNDLADKKDREFSIQLLSSLVMRYSTAEIRLKELNDLKNRFLGIAAHDLRNPLASIRGFSEIMLEGDAGPITDEQREFITIMHDASDHMLGLVNDLLDIAVIESGKLDFKMQSASLSETVMQRVHINNMVAQKKEISIETRLDDLTCQVWFDSDRIGQVVDNLLGNAIKFSPRGSRILVSAHDEGDMARVEVRDQGPGVTPEDQMKLFGVFQKLAARPTEGEKSTGLGLSIAKKIIEGHNGSIGVKSLPGEGSTFYFTLPYSK